MLHLVLVPITSRTVKGFFRFSKLNGVYQVEVV